MAMSGLEPYPRTTLAAETIVGRLVSMKTCSGGCWRDVIRMTGLLTVSPAGSVTGLGRYQFASNSNAKSEAPTHPIYFKIGIAISPYGGSKRRNP